MQSMHAPRAARACSQNTESFPPGVHEHAQTTAFFLILCCPQASKSTEIGQAGDRDLCTVIDVTCQAFWPHNPSPETQRALPVQPISRSNATQAGGKA